MNPQELQRLLAWLQSNPDIMKQYEQTGTQQDAGSAAMDGGVPDYLQDVAGNGQVSVPTGISKDMDLGLPKINYQNISLPSNNDMSSGNRQLPSNYLEADYNNDSVPDYLQDTGSTTKTPKKRGDFASDGEYANYLKSQGVSDKDIQALDLKMPKTSATGNKAMQDAVNPFFFPGGSNLQTELWSLGRGIGAEKGAKGKLASIIGGGGAAAMDIARNVASGLAFQKQENYARQWYRDRQQDNNYTPISGAGNTNTVGGGYGKYGGLFEDGGFMGDESQAQPMEQEQPQDPAMQIQQVIVEMLQSGTPPEQVLQMLVEQGVPQEQASQMVRTIMQQMQQGSSQTQQPEQFNKNVGDEVTFKYGGKTVKGKIKKVEGGKFYI